MDRYGGRTHGTEGSQADPAAEWSSPGGETGLEEPVWQLEISGGVESYPERPDEADCIYYLRTGFCGYGPRCRFNHPRDRGSAVGIIRASGRDYPERVDQPVCQYYMRTGMCKFGSSCKYHHPKQGVGTVNQVLLNVYGYPLRPGEKECSYYMKTMQCKFGATCKFHHPQPAGIEMVAPGHLPAPAIYQAVQPPVESSQQYGMVSGNWPVARPAMLPSSYVPGAYGAMMLPPGMVSIPGWSSYPAPVGLVASPGTQPTVGAGPMYGITQLSSSAPAFTGPYISTPSPSGPSGSGQKEHSFPQRPGEPECQFYMKTGDCKFGSSCKYHHPPGLVSAKGYLALSPIGLPLRPGVELCSHYAQSGVCKFGPSCKFDHPMGGTTTLRYSPSASSLTDMPVTPYPIGSSIAIMAPSSSSANLRPELRNTASAPFGSTFSKNNGSTSIGHKGEISKTP